MSWYAFLLTLTGTSLAMSNSKDNTKFEWLATESAPRHYPMEILKGEFYYHGKDYGLSIPHGGTLSSGWGRGISNHHMHDRPEPLPDRLKIIFSLMQKNSTIMGSLTCPMKK